MFIISCGRFIFERAHTLLLLWREVTKLSVLHLALVFLVGVSWFFIVVNRLLECPQHVLLQGLLLENQTVLVPGKIWGLQVETVTLHARVEQVEDVPVVGVVREAQLSAVAHELLELLGLVLAEFLNGHLLLFSLNVVVLFVLGSSRESLPWERAF